MKITPKLIYFTTAALAVCVAGTDLQAQDNASAQPVITNTQQGDTVMTHENVQHNPQKDDTLWEKTKDVSSDAWEKTKDGSAKAWDKTKEVSSDAWEATKDGSAKAWDKTKEVSSDAWEATKDGAAKAKDAVTD